ncbi:replication protein P [Endozoicomonas sp. ALB091]|uniref:replication protein P n=1 Tax=Endozoicomonas sp. ALB091 TaxID=3403073 RepID=UPI003BB7EAB1
MGRQKPEPAKSSSTPTTWLTPHHVAVLLERLSLIHPWFRRDYPTPADLKAISTEYARVLTERKISEAHFTHGLGRIADQEHYPNPARFAALCQAAAQPVGLPSVADAFREACDRSADPKAASFSHMAVYLAGRATGWYELRHCATAQQLQSLKKNFADHYRQLSTQSEPELLAQLPKPKTFHPLPPPPDYDKQQSAADARAKLKGLFSDSEPAE